MNDMDQRIQGLAMFIMARHLTQVKFEVPGKPVSWARAGSNGSRRFTPPEQAKYKDRLKNIARKHCDHPHEGPVVLKVSAFFPIPKSWPKWKQHAATVGLIRPSSKPDVDNVLKMVMDALNEVAYKDDALIVNAEVCAWYQKNPYVDVDVVRYPSITREIFDAIKDVIDRSDKSDPYQMMVDRVEAKLDV